MNRIALGVREPMAVNLERGLRARVSEKVLDLCDGRARQDQRGREAMSERVHIDAAETGATQRTVEPIPEHIAPMSWQTRRRREY